MFLNIITDNYIGGAGKVLQNYLLHYNKHEYDILVVLPKNSALKGVLEKHGASVIGFDKLTEKSMNFKSILPMRSLLKRVKPDIVHTHASLSSRIAARLCGNCKIVYTRHCAYPPSNFM